MPSAVIEAFYGAAAEVESLVRGFESCTLPHSKWTHAAHLTVALWYLVHHPPECATALVREGIKRYNAANGIVTTETSGYHETLTLFWLSLVRIYLSSVSSETHSLLSLANGVIGRCGNKHLPLEYYSRERLFSLEARRTWVEPDLKELTI
jgi:hypothetical protein